MRALLLAPGVLAIAIFAACHGDVATEHGSGGAAGTGPSGALVSACASSAPTFGDSCDDTGLLCEYGDDLDWNCNVVAHCSPSQRWEQGSFGGTCPSPPLGVGGSCPSSHAVALQGGTCPKDGEVCAYSEGICVCTAPAEIGPGEQDASIPPSTWQCAAPSAGCPPFRPRIGSACAKPDLQCDYGVCGVPEGSAYRCDGAGYWTDSFGTPCGGA